MNHLRWLRTIAVGTLLCACSSSSSSESTGTGGAPGHGGGAPGGNSGVGEAETYDVDIAIDCASHVGDTADAACDSYAAALCKLMVSCWVADINVDSQADCETRMKLQCALELGAPGTGLTPAAIGAIGDQLGSHGCAFYRNLQGKRVRLTGECIDDGTLQDGSGCAFDSQCAGGVCSLEYDAVCGKCTGSEGKPCGYQCGYGSSCVNDVCKPYPILGEPCSSARCSGTAVCDYSGTKTCVQGKAEGEACTGSGQCLNWLGCYDGTCRPDPLGRDGASCTGGLFTCDMFMGYTCDSSTYTCRPGLIGKLGEPCGLTKTSWSCGFGARCARAKGELEGKCVALTADGQSCNFMDGPQCRAPARCVGGVCTSPDPAECK